jgi:hypothetical protein
MSSSWYQMSSVKLVLWTGIWRLSLRAILMLQIHLDMMQLFNTTNNLRLIQCVWLGFSITQTRHSMQEEDILKCGTLLFFGGLEKGNSNTKQPNSVARWEVVEAKSQTIHCALTEIAHCFAQNIWPEILSLYIIECTCIQGRPVPHPPSYVTVRAEISLLFQIHMLLIRTYVRFWPA